MMRKATLVLFGAAAGAAMALLATQPHMIFVGATAKAAAADTYRQLNLFGDVFERVRADYVEAPDDSKLIESAINGMLAGLDPHSSYMDPKSFKDMQVQTRGEFGGLGIEVTMEDGLIEQAARVVAQVEDVTLEPVVAHLRRYVGDRFLQAFGSLFVELRQADIADVVTLDARAHRTHADDIARDRHFDRLVLPFANNGELDLGVHGPTHFLNRLVQG